MTAKEYLGQAYRIDQRINSKMEQIVTPARLFVCLHEKAEIISHDFQEL